MGQTGGFAASSWLVRQAASATGGLNSRDIIRKLLIRKTMATRVRSLVAFLVMQDLH